MDPLLDLKLTTIKLCKKRKHTLTAFTPSIDNHSHTAYCHGCDGTVTVTLDPRPNEIDIGGPLVAVDCARNFD